MTVSFVTVAVVLLVVFVAVTLTVREQVRRSVIANLQSTGKIFEVLEKRRQGDMLAQASALADNASLKAAVDTLQVEGSSGSDESRAIQLETIDRELKDVAAALQPIDLDAIVLVDGQDNALAAEGRLADRWPRNRHVLLAPNIDKNSFDGITRVGDAVFRLVAVPLRLPDAKIGTLYLAKNLDNAYAKQLSTLSSTEIAILADGIMIATTLRDKAARAFESAVAAGQRQSDTVVLDDESYAYRRLVAYGGTTFYALGSIDEQSRDANTAAMRSLALVGATGLTLALVGSFALARLLTEPIGRLSSLLAAMTASHDVATPLPPTGSSLEIDALTETFNGLMSSVALAEAETRAAYTGAIRALAAALDARDPYTAGHSERVSALAVAIGRTLSLPGEDIDVLRLGALLHDIGKIGVPDRILMKPGTLTEAEYAAIKQHPVLGARILKSVPFLAQHIPIVELHHERPDGRGYPHGLRGDDIPIPARIVHVADAYDAMTSARAYRGARPSADAVRELWRCAGTEFHAEIVAALATALPGVTSDARDAVLEHA
jgi:putative nucleotidyltransferase with HDIG domain